jgi:hypothetical protein
MLIPFTIALVTVAIFVATLRLGRAPSRSVELTH